MKLCFCSTAFKYIQKERPTYMNEVFRLAENTRIHTRNSYLKLNHPFQKTSNGENDLSYIGVEEVLKKRENLNVFKLEMNTTI